LIPTGSSAICGCEESRITVSYRAAGRRGSRAPNRHVIQPLSYIGGNANLRIKSSFGNGLFLSFLVHPFTDDSHSLLSHSRLPHSFHYNLTGTRLRGCVGILYIRCSVFVSVRYTFIYYCYRFSYIWYSDSVTFLTVCTHVVASRLSYSYTANLLAQFHNSALFH